MTCEKPVLFTLTEPPMEAMAAVTVVPTSIPMTSAAACSKLIACVKSAVRVAATPALEDCVMMVAKIPSRSSFILPMSESEGRFFRSNDAF